VETISTKRPPLPFPALRSWELDSAQTAMLAGVLLITTLVYLRCLANGFVYDDLITVEANKYIGQWSYIWKYSFTRDLWWFLDPNERPISTFYHPLQSVWFGIAYHLFGRNPVGWHVLKIALHLVTVIICFRVAQLLTRSTSAGLFAALLFGVMPIHAEPVIWAVDLPEPLSSAFELGALCLFIQRSKPGWRGIVWPVLLFVAASLSHEMSVVFPLLIAAYVYLLEADGANKQGERDAASSTMPAASASFWQRVGNAAFWSAPFWGVTLLYLGLRALVLGRAQVLGLTPKKEVATLADSKVVFHFVDAGHSLVQGLMTIPSYTVCYLRVILIPWFAGPGHDVKPTVTLSLRDFFIPLSILVIIGWVGYSVLRRSSRRNLYLFCIVWWIVTLSPALLNLDQVIGEAHDRYEYLGSFGFCVLVSDYAVRFSRRDAFRRRLVVGLGTALTIVYLATLWRVEPVWHDNLVLYTNVVEAMPNSTHFRLALASELERHGQSTAALAQFQEVEKITPDDANIHLFLGLLYLKLHRGNDATKELAAYYRTAFGLKKPAEKQHWYVEFK
jgi:hypothetical protein